MMLVFFYIMCLGERIFLLLKINMAENNIDHEVIVCN